MEEIVLQTNGDLFVSPLIGGRWQILASVTPTDTYYIVDHSRPELILKDDDRTVRFDDKISAERWIKSFTSPEGSGNMINPIGTSPDGLEENDTMARSPKANAAAVKAATEADKVIGGKRGVKAAAKTADADKQLAAATGKKNGAKVPAPAPERVPAATGLKSVAGRKGTMASVFRELIAGQPKNKLTDEAIHEKVEAQFSKKIPSNAVAHYRADVEKRVAAGVAI